MTHTGCSVGLCLVTVLDGPLVSGPFGLSEIACQVVSCIFGLLESGLGVPLFKDKPIVLDGYESSLWVDQSTGLCFFARAILCPCSIRLADCADATLLLWLERSPSNP